MNLKIGFNNTSVRFKALYLIKAIALIILCRVHDFTRYKVCRTFSDLFYWPEGPCVDMLVIFSVFIVMALMLYDTFFFYAKCRIKVEDKTEDNDENDVILFPGPRY